MLPIASLLTMLFACDMCDALDTGAKAHPFAISATWVPKCDQAQQRFVASDPWPTAGEVRRDSFTRECADVQLTRAFVTAPDGFTAGELFVSAMVERKRGRDVMRVRQHEFIGTSGALSYRYGITAAEDGSVSRVIGTVDGARITSHLVGTALAADVRPKRLNGQAVACEAWRKRCELMSRRVDGDVALPFFTVQFDEAYPAGNLCVDAGSVANGEGGARLVADGVSVADDARAAPGSSSVCLGAGSEKALAALGRARRLFYEAGESDGAELDTMGLVEAIALGRYLFANAVSRAQRSEIEARLRPPGEAMLK